MNGMPPMPRRVKKLPLTAARNVRMRNKPKRQQGKRGLRGMKSIAGQQHDGNAPAAPGFRRALSVCSPNTSSTYDSSAMPEPKRIEPDDIQRIGLLAIVRQMQIDHPQTDEADRNVDEKNDAPVKIADDQAAGDGPEHGADQARDRDEAHGADEFGFGERPHDGEPPDRHHHGAPAALQDAAGHQHVDVGRYAAEKRPESEQADGGGENAARSEPIRHPAADRNEDREAQRVAGEHRLHAERGDFERLRDGGHRRVQNRGVERLHEERDRHQPRQQSFAGVARAHGVTLAGGLPGHRYWHARGTLEVPKKTK